MKIRIKLFKTKQTMMLGVYFISAKHRKIKLFNVSHFRPTLLQFMKVNLENKSLNENIQITENKSNIQAYKSKKKYIKPYNNVII